MENIRRFSFLLNEEESLTSNKEQNSMNTEPERKKEAIQFPTKGIFFREKFQKKYLVTIDSMMNLGGMVTKSKVEIRWQLTLKEIQSNSYAFELITLDHAMVEDDGGLKEMHKLVLQMQKALNEICFTTNLQGELVEINNLAAIKERWKSVKKEAFVFTQGMTNIQELFSVQEEVFESKGGVENMVKAMEFFGIYLNGFYGKSFPIKVNKPIPNIFRSTEIPFNLTYSEDVKSDNVYTIVLQGKLGNLDNSWMQKAYGNFPFFKIDELRPEFTYKGKYEINVTNGILTKGELQYKENIHDKLSGEITYKIESYE